MKKNKKELKQKFLILESEKIKFNDLLRLIYENRDEDGVLRNLIIKDCLITKCPKDSKIITIFQGTKYKGRKVALFCGFICENCIIVGNYFQQMNNLLRDTGRDQLLKEVSSLFQIKFGGKNEN